jgi:hypothetical protein
VSKLDGTDDIGSVGTADNQDGILVNHPIPDLAGSVVALIAHAVQFTTQTGLEGLKGRRVGLYM